MKTYNTIIDHPSELNALSSFPFSRKRGLGKIVLSEAFQHEDREQLEKDINTHYYACGCNTSAKYLLSGLVIGVLLVAGTNFLPNYQLNLSPITTILVTTIGGGILGKIVGLLSANAKLKRSIHTVQALWRPKIKSPMKKQPDCG